jgi:hypothetical protein
MPQSIGKDLSKRMKKFVPKPEIKKSLAKFEGGKNWLKREATLERVHDHLPKKLTKTQIGSVLKLRGYSSLTEDVFTRRSSKGGLYVVRIKGSDNPDLIVSHSGIGESRPAESTDSPEIQEINQIMRRMRNLARKPSRKP